MSEIILHHYPQSPVSEKVRVGLGIKELCWNSVQIPRIPPKPDVIALTGGYRRTPIMQIGADIYCDSLCILHVLERRIPNPSFFPDGNERWSLSNWTDGEFFRHAIAVVLGSEVDNLPIEFAADRGRLYFGPDYDLHVLARDLGHLVGQLRAHFRIMQQLLGHHKFMHGVQPGLVDALCYYLVWFIRGRYEGGPGLLDEFTQLQEWEKRVKAIGHGKPKEMSAEESIDIALKSESEWEPTIDIDDPLGLRTNDLVDVSPDGDGGDLPVRGALVALTSDRVAIRRSQERVGEVVVHFPRLGYRVRAVNSN